MSETALIFRQWSFEDNGRKWVLDRPNLATERAYSTYLEGRDLENLRRHRLALGEQDYKIGVEGWRHDMLTGAYRVDWLSPLFWETLQDTDNIEQLLYFWMTQRPKQEGLVNPAVERAEVAEMFTRRRKDLEDMLGEALSEKNPFAQSPPKKAESPASPSTPSTPAGSWSENPSNSETGKSSG